MFRTGSYEKKVNCDDAKMNSLLDFFILSTVKFSFTY